MESKNEIYQFIDLEYLKATCSNDLTMMQIVMNTFVAKTPGLVDALSESVTDGNLNEVRALAHKLKSSFVTFGAKGLSEILGVIEAKSSEENTEDSRKVLESIQGLMQDVKKLSAGVFGEINNVLNK